MKLGQEILRLIGLPKVELRRTEPFGWAASGAVFDRSGSRFVDPVRVGGPMLLAPVPDTNVAIARRLVTAGGSGDESDVEAVVKELAELPTWVLERAEQYHVRVVACRGSVTDHLTHLRGVRPRGWPPGATWDTVPGSGGDPVVIATIAAPDGTRQVPPKGRGHGAESLVRHELGHSLDFKKALGLDSRSREFMDAYGADVEHMQRERAAYLLQDPPAGPEEAFAEMFDWFCAKKGAPPKWGPNLYALFAQISRDQGGVT